MTQTRYAIDPPARGVPALEMSVVLTRANDKKFNPGRRAEVKYQDLGLQAATAGTLRAEVMHIGGGGPSRPTGWHYHTAEVQFLHVIKGWVKMEFPDLGVLTLEVGDSITIPGGTVHQELESSNPLELLEVTLPGPLGTVNVDAPEWGQEKASDYGAISAPIAR